MAICPPLLVAAPPLTPYTGGLFAAALFPPLPADTHWQCGLQYEALCPGRAGTWVESCPTDPPPVPQPSKQLARWRGEVLAPPFTVYDGFLCPPVGRPPADAEAKARATLLLSEQATAEEAFWVRELANPGCRVLGGGPVPLVSAVSLLEAFLAENYGASGIIHAPRGVAPYAAERRQVDPRNGKLTTALGTRWAFGGGYTVNVGPNGQPAPAQHAWMYVTGETTIYRSEVFTVEPRLDTKTNELVALAERTYVILHECVCAAVLVSLTDCCPPVPAVPAVPGAAPADADTDDADVPESEEMT